MKKIQPLIICGGNGTRLWPVSRTESPKQFQRVGGKHSETFFQAAVRRHLGREYARPLVIASARHEETVHAQLAEIGVEADVILEPVGRNTGPAVLASALWLAQRDPDTIMVVVPADHIIEGDVTATIRAMRKPASDGYIITFGIKPRYAETGFGYITDGGPVIEYPGLRKVERFVEKPPRRKARLLVESDIAYWASGISMFSARTIIDEFRQFDPESFAAVRDAVNLAQDTPGGLLLEKTAFANAASQPTEVTVFEKTRRIALCPMDVAWSDVGSWSAMYGISHHDALGNVLHGDVVAVESTNCMVRSDDRLVTLVGVSDIIVVDTPDALLVTRVGHCQSVKKVAEHLKAGGRVEAERHRDSDHEWGEVRQVMSRENFEVSSLTLNAGQAITFTPAECRQATVVHGAVEIEMDGKCTHLGVGDRIELRPDTGATVRNVAGHKSELVLMTFGERADRQGPSAAAAGG